MAIRSRMGSPITIKRVATMADAPLLGRDPSTRDTQAIKDGSLVVVNIQGVPGDRLYHRGDLRADGGINEVDAAIVAASE